MTLLKTETFTCFIQQIYNCDNYLSALVELDRFRLPYLQLDLSPNQLTLSAVDKLSYHVKPLAQSPDDKQAKCFPVIAIVMLDMITQPTIMLPFSEDIGFIRKKDLQAAKSQQREANRICKRSSYDKSESHQLRPKQHKNSEASQTVKCPVFTGDNGRRVGVRSITKNPGRS
ncbi:hypothetical protein GJ496_010697 [Pomphorhynchus laevis]|nr:hypothetical protein GJ496_010697 [Pomphorhynchus laevis]